MNIVLIGHLCIDKNISESTSYTSWGSALMYMAQYYKAAVDAKISLISPYGKDFLEYASGYNLFPEPRVESTLVYKNITKNGKRTQSCENYLSAKPPVFSEEIKGLISAADILIFAPLLPNYPPSYVAELMSAKKPGCLTALSPQGYFRQLSDDGVIMPRKFIEAKELLPLFDLMVLSEEDLPDAAEYLKSLSKDIPNIKIVMTQGDKGANLISPDKNQHVPTLVVPADEVVDSVGCGDVFSAACIYKFYKTKNIIEAMKAGNIAAGEKLRSSPVN